jgi:hypothetical protein
MKKENFKVAEDLFYMDVEQKNWIKVKIPITQNKKV